MTAARIIFGWRCVACRDEGSSATWDESQADLEAHWRITHERPMPEQNELVEWET